tara:strand:- start:273 stop:1160 length:888 start_codon:yes stop_codon:yes gene_type:complete
MGMAIDAIGFLLVLVSIPLAFGILRLFSKDDSLEFVSFIGQRSTLYAILGLVLLLVIPYGVFVVLPIVVALSFASPAGRLDWTEFRNRRLMAGFLVLLMLGGFGFMPTDTPRAPEEWGEPFATENPYAPAWPSSQQYTWVFVEPMNPTNFEVVQSLVLRTPHQHNPFLQVESSIWISSLLGMQESRMRQAIDLVDERIPLLRIDSEAFRLDQKGEAQSHTFRPSSGNVELNVWVYECYATSGTDPEGTNVGEVVIVGQSNWGGTIELLVVVRPFSHDGLASDPYAESIVNQWLVV